MFVAEDGSGLANANSLATVEFADEYHDLRGNTAWANFDLPTKQQLLVKGTDYVVDVFSGALAGSAVSGVQALPYPRLNFKVNGFSADSISVPFGVKAAVAELALVAKTTPLQTNVTRGKKSVQIGSLKVEYDGNSPVQTLFVAAARKMAPFLLGYASNGVNVALRRV